MKTIGKNRGWLFYDGKCALCVGTVRKVKWLFPKLGIQTETLHAPWVAQKLALPHDQLTSQGWMITPEGRLIGGADIWIYVARQFWWGFPFTCLAAIPSGRWVIRRTYRLIASNRYNIVGAWQRVKAASWPGWLPLAVSLPAAMFLRTALAPWAFMWVLCFVLFFGCKWLTFWKSQISNFKFTRALGYLLAWPGMDPAPFFSPTAKPNKPTLAQWAGALLKTGLGAFLVWVVTPFVPASDILLAGWTGMIGLVFVLHFGSFDLLSLAWRRIGVDARPIMRAPILSTSLGEFWSLRWNLAFRQLCRDFVFRPLQDRAGVSGAMLAVFFVSGLIHELVISFPAQGGYGLPTAYFMLQGLGVLFEHSKIGRKIGIQKGFRGWLFTLLLAAGPAFWLFHPPFIHNVMVPFLKTIHAMEGGVAI